MSLGNAGVSPSQFPLKFTADANSVTPNCNLDFAAFAVNAAGSSSQANIIGFRNLYVNSSGTGFCPGTSPTVMFSYYVGTGVVQTSPELSLDGAKLLFVESKAAASRLHVVQIGSAGANGTSATAPAVPGSGNNAADTAVTLAGNVMVTRSSVFYNYSNDTAYVGDDNGVLHKFSPVFSGTLAEVTSGGWPITVAAGSILTAPTLDISTQNIYLGDALNGELWYVRDTGSATGICYNSGSPPCLGGYVSGSTTYAGIPVGNGTANKPFGGVVDPPLVVGGAGEVFAASGSSAAVNCSNDAAVVVQAANDFSSVVYECIGQGDLDNLHFGAFDNAYFNNVGSGHLYWTGNGSAAPAPVVWSLGFNSSGVLASATEIPALQFAAGALDAAPLTAAFDAFTATDWLSASVPNNSCGGATNGGCVMAFNITNGAAGNLGPWLPNTNFALANEVIDTEGVVQRVTTAGTSGGVTPGWHATGTTVDGTNVEATGTGAFSTNTAAGGQYVTINGVQLTAATPTPSSQTGAFSAAPPSTPGITIRNGSTNTLTLTTNATTASATGTFSGFPASSSAPSITITNSAGSSPNTLTMATNATAATGSGTFTADISPLTSTIRITNGANTVAFTPSNSVAATVNGTFAGDPMSGSVQITNGANSETLSVSPGVGATGSGTFSGSPASGIVLITNGANVTTLLPSAGVAASATGAFTGNPANGQTVTITAGGNMDRVTASLSTPASATGTFSGNPANGQTISITNGAQSAVLAASLSNPASATGTFTANPAPGQAVTITNGNNVLLMSVAAQTTATGSATIATDPATWPCAPAPTVTVGGTIYSFVCGAPTAVNQVEQSRAAGVNANENRTAMNFEAVINAAPAQCFNAGCVFTGQAANGKATATEATNVVALTATSLGSAGDFPLSSAYGGVTVSGGNNGSDGTNACPTSNSGTFIGAVGNPAAVAANLAAAINLCPAAAGITASPANNVVTVTATIGGTAGNSVSLGSYSAAPAYATGAVTIAADPLEWPCPLTSNVTVAGVAYTPYQCSVPLAVNQVEQFYNGGSPAADEAGQARNLEAVINAVTSQCKSSNCVYSTQTASSAVIATVAANVITLTARNAGVLGDFSVTTNDTTNFTVSGGNNGTNGSGAMTGFAWSGATLSGGTNGVTSSTSFAVDGVLADDATQLAAAINLNTAAVGISAAASGAVVTVTASVAGAGGNSIALASGANGYAWSGATLVGGVNGMNTGADFAVDGVLADDASNLAAALNRNVGAVGITAAASGTMITVTANAGGAAGNNITLAETLTGFAWSGARLTGGVNGNNGGVYFMTDGIPTDNATNLAASINRNRSAGVEAWGAASGSNVTVTAVRGTVGNGFTLSTYINPTTATGTVTSCSAGPAVGDTLTIGGIRYWFAPTAASCPKGVPCIYQSTTSAGAAADITAAINKNGAQCEAGFTDNCYWNITANGAVTAAYTAGNNYTTVSAQVPGAAGNTIVFTDHSSCMTLSPNTGMLAGGNNGMLGPLDGFAWSGGNPVNLAGGVNGTTSATTFFTDGDVSHDAANLATAINYNTGSVGVSASSSGATATVSAGIRGPSGNSIQAGPATLPAGFSWSCGMPPCDFSGGAYGSNVPPNFAIDGSVTDDAANLSNSINAYTGALGVSAVANASAGKVSLTATSLGTESDAIGLSLTGKNNNNGKVSVTSKYGEGAYNGDSVLIWATYFFYEDTDTDCPNADPCMWWGLSNSDAAQTLAAAINDDPTLCPSDVTGTWQYTCFSNVTTTNTVFYATYNSANPADVIVTNTNASSIAFHYGENSLGIVSITLNPANGSIPGDTAPTGFTWSGSTLTGATNGTNSCPTAAGGTFALSSGNSAVPTTTTEATELAQAINLCPAAAGVTATTSGSTVTVTDRIVGPYLAVGAANNSGIYSWGAVNGGSAGSNTCPASTTGTYATSNNTSALAANLAAAINACPTPAMIGVSASSAANVVTVTSLVPGTTGGANITLGGGPAGFTWTGSTLAGGTNGTTTGNYFQVWSGAGDVSATQLAANLATAVNNNSGTIGAGATSSGASITLTAGACGWQDDYPLASALSGFSWSGPAMTGGRCAMVWTAQGAGNGETTAVQPTGTSGIIIDNVFFPAWTANNAYPASTRITDSNSNVQQVTTSGTSGASAPAWNTTDGGTTTDGTVVWTNQGALPTANLYVGTLNGSLGNKAVKYTQNGLQ